MSDTEQPMTPGSSATAAPPATEVKFTEKEDRVLKVVFQCMRTVPEVDMKKLTELAGFNTEKTCSNTWGVIKKKLAAIAEQNGGSLATTPKSKKGTTPKKRSKTGEDGEDNGDGDGDSPTKKPRKTPAKKSKVKAEETGDEDAAEGASPGEDVAETPAKKPRKTPVKKAAKVKDEVHEDAADAAEADA
ncbi:PWWP domain-containing protein2 [Elsinoe australis]|uniref:PWWP domain-containing protein2 n=1 Tax=Elsinoe australis TaxID=40998 RepID=A0A2P8A893_9PEZI|nr:PWWP domain-containing protein2 [Elsinoe australis]